MVQALTATRAGRCSRCGESIALGDEFTWGRARGERIHPACGDQPKPAAPRVVEARAWSSYQQALFDESGTERSLIINAVAGSGKTTTIEEFCRRLSEPVLYLVFNRKNADEAQERMPAHVSADTFHSTAWKALKPHLGGRCRIDASKMRKLFRSMVEHGQVTEREADTLGPAAQKLVALAKNTGIGVPSLAPDHLTVWKQMAEHYDVDVNGDLNEYPEGPDQALERAIEIARRLLEMSNAATDTVDFDDMLYLTVKLRVPLRQYRIVCVDEAQDTNAIQRELLHMMLAPRGRLIAVGDPRQAIYGFRGAEADAMEKIRAEFDCHELPLSVNYRCSTSVIEVAKRYCPQIVAHDGAPEGSVSTRAMTYREFVDSDVILCRNTAPLMRTAYRMIAAGRGCVVLGRDIGDQLLGVLKKAGGRDYEQRSLDDLEARVEAMTHRDAENARARGHEERAEAMWDRYECLTAAISSLTEDNRTVPALVKAITSLFVDQGNGRLTLATVHKAKGLEWERVFILDPHRMPSKYARLPWQLEQENNLIYVAYTRAKVDLVYVDSQAITEGGTA